MINTKIVNKAYNEFIENNPISLRIKALIEFINKKNNNLELDHELIDACDSLESLKRGK